jgi:hypothetical protein
METSSTDIASNAPRACSYLCLFLMACRLCEPARYNLVSALSLQLWLHHDKVRFLRCLYDFQPLKGTVQIFLAIESFMLYNYACPALELHHRYCTIGTGEQETSSLHFCNNFCPFLI